MNGIGKIVGFPVKLFPNNRIYIPFEYLRYYGISEKKDRVNLIRSENSLFYRAVPRFQTDHARKGTVSIRFGLTALPTQWVRDNNLKPGDTLFLLGLTDGLLLYTLPIKKSAPN